MNEKKNDHKSPLEENPGLNSKIFIVDDEKPIRELIELSLRELGYHQIQSYEDGQLALQVITDPNNEDIPDLVLLDNRMPRLTGVEFSSKISNRFQAGSLSSVRPEIVLITGADLEDSINLDEGGIYCIVKKPIDLELLGKAVVESLKHHKEKNSTLNPIILSTDMQEFLEEESKKSFILATFDAGRELGLKEDELLFEDNLEQEIREIIESAHKSGLSGYLREDAIKALIQEHNYRDGDI